MMLLNPLTKISYINLHIRDKESKVQAEQDAWTNSIAQINKVWTWELDTLGSNFSLLRIYWITHESYSNALFSSFLIHKMEWWKW